MTSAPRTPPNESAEETQTRLAFYFFVGTLSVALIGFLWFLIQSFV